MEVSEDRQAWDDRVARLGGHPLQSWAWGELKRRYGWRPLRVVSPDGEAAAQVLIRPLLGLAVAYVPRGPATSGRAESQTVLLAGLERLARRRRAAFLRLEPDAVEGSFPGRELDRRLRSRRYRMAAPLQPRASLALDVSRPPEQIWASFSKGHRADIRRAEREGVSVRAGGERDAETLHALLRATQERKAFGIHSAAYYRDLLAAFGDAARLFVAEHDGQSVAATLAVAWAGRGIYLVAGSNAEGLRHRAGHLLQWYAIRWARDCGARTYDLWGIPDARARLDLEPAADVAERERLEAAARADPLDGVYRYKKGWGAEAVRMLPAYDAVYFAPAYWLWQRRRGSAG